MILKLGVMVQVMVIQHSKAEAGGILRLVLAN
jgi:hypothetical protein